MAVQTQIQTRRGTAASWTSTNPTLAAGEFGYETDTGKFKIGNGSTAWASLAYTAASTAVTYLFNATSGQTTFSGADANGLTLAYTVGAEQVYLNGVLQVRGSDYTATNGTSIVLASGALTSDVLNVIAYSAMTVTDTYTQAQADAKFVQQTNNFFAGKNKILNGDFSVNQYALNSTGVSFGTACVIDRWIPAISGATGTASLQPFTPGTAPVAGYESTSFFRMATSIGNDFCRATQRIEDVRTFAGQTVTLSFWAKGTNPTTAGKLNARLQQNFGTGGSTAVATAEGNLTLTSSWTRYSFTFSVPSVSGTTIGVNSFLAVDIGQLANTSTDSWTLDLWGVQLEAGSIATPFQTATGTLAGELAACQRYYQLVASGTAENVGTGFGWGTTEIDFTIPLKVTLRGTPTLVATSGTSYFQAKNSGTTIAISGAWTLGNGSTNNPLIYAAVTGATNGQSYQIVTNNASASIAFSAEL